MSFPFDSEGICRIDLTQFNSSIMKVIGCGRTISTVRNALCCCKGIQNEGISFAVPRDAHRNSSGPTWIALIDFAVIRFEYWKCELSVNHARNAENTPFLWLKTKEIQFCSNSHFFSYVARAFFSVPSLFNYLFLFIILKWKEEAVKMRLCGQLRHRPESVVLC